MAPGRIKLEVITPDQVLLQQEVDAVTVPAAEGYLGILPGHARLVTALAIGAVTWKEKNGEDRLSLAGGILEVAEDRVVVLADTAELRRQIDTARARRSLERARKRLNERPEGVDTARAREAWKRALNRLQVAGEQV